MSREIAWMTSTGNGELLAAAQSQHRPSLIAGPDQTKTVATTRAWTGTQRNIASGSPHCHETQASRVIEVLGGWNIAGSLGSLGVPQYCRGSARRPRTNR